jgi:isopropylmalate/isohomocitrate dehydrogenase-like protein
VKRVVVIEGDGIGKEVIPAAVRVLEATDAPLELIPAKMGLECRSRIGTYLPDETLRKLDAADSCLFGAIQSPMGDPTYQSPLLFLRRHYDLYANVRPARRLHPDLGKGDLDLVIVRENSEGMYTGAERDVEGGVILERKVTEQACRRIVRFAIRLSKERGFGSVTCVHKANVLRRSDGLFRRVFLEQMQGSGLEAREMLVDAAAAALITKPREFECIVTLNLYGDILSDEAAALIGGLGFGACANIGERFSIFEPCHGSAPDIAGKGVANPTGAMLCAAMMLSHLGMREEAERVDRAVRRALANGFRTPDAGGGCRTAAYTDAVVAKVREG